MSTEKKKFWMDGQDRDARSLLESDKNGGGDAGRDGLIDNPQSAIDN